MTKIKAKTSTKNEAKRTKTKAKAYRRITKASTSKTSATKTSAPMADDDIGHPDPDITGDIRPLSRGK